MSVDNLTDRELLVQIDTRQEGMASRIKAIEIKLEARKCHTNAEKIRVLEENDSKRDNRIWVIILAIIVTAIKAFLWPSGTPTP